MDEERARGSLRWHSRKIPQDELNFMANVQASTTFTLTHDVRVHSLSKSGAAILISWVDLEDIFKQKTKCAI